MSEEAIHIRNCGIRNATVDCWDEIIIKLLMTVLVQTLASAAAVFALTIGAKITASLQSP
jgi:hypothetical protein